MFLVSQTPSRVGTRQHQTVTVPGACCACAARPGPAIAHAADSNRAVVDRKAPPGVTCDIACPLEGRTCRAGLIAGVADVRHADIVIAGVLERHPTILSARCAKRRPTTRVASCVAGSHAKLIAGPGQGCRRPHRAAHCRWGRLGKLAVRQSRALRGHTRADFRRERTIRLVERRPAWRSRA